MHASAVLFDFSGTLFRLEGDDSWFTGMELVNDDGRRAVDEHAQAELMDRLTHPTGGSVTRTAEAYHAWVNRDLKPALHREAYLHALADAGLSGHHAEALYRRAIDPDSWVPYPDTVEVLRSLEAGGVRTAVVSNIAFDIRPALEAAGAKADEIVLSYEVGVVKPDPRIFQIALERLGVEAHEAIMVGDSEENDGGARAIGCDFILVDPLPVAERPTGLIDPLRARGVAL
ncbi:haloacid dehalogenase [Mycolicibacterium litorale]|nr:haloacid dehalogenase [Mycolicibacterium litorale]